MSYCKNPKYELNNGYWECAGCGADNWYLDDYCLACGCGTAKCSCEECQQLEKARIVAMFAKIIDGDKGNAEGGL